jgi:hypothetical protein
MEILNAFMGQSMLAQMGEIVMFANTVTMSMPTRWKNNVVMDYVSKVLNFLSMNVFKNRNMDDR